MNFTERQKLILIIIFISSLTLIYMILNIYYTNHIINNIIEDKNNLEKELCNELITLNQQEQLTNYSLNLMCKKYKPIFHLLK